MSSVNRYTSHPATSPAAVGTMRLPVLTSTCDPQCGHFIPFVSAATSPPGTIFPQTGHTRLATLHLAVLKVTKKSEAKRYSKFGKRGRPFASASPAQCLTNKYPGRTY